MALRHGSADAVALAPLRAELGVFGEPIDPVDVARGELSRGTPTRTRGERAGSARGAVSSSATRLERVR